MPAPCPQQQPSGLPAEKAMRARASPAMPALATTARDVHKEMHQGLVFEAAAGARPRGQEETKRPRGRAAADAPMIHEERERAPSAAAVPSVTRRSIDCPCIGWPCKLIAMLSYTQNSASGRGSSSLWGVRSRRSDQTRSSDGRLCGSTG